MTEQRPLTLRLPHWLFTPQFVAAFRLTVFAFGLIVSGGVWAYNHTLGGVLAEVAEVKDVQASRAVDGESFQAQIRGQVATVQGDIKGLQGDMYDVKVDIGVIKRLLGDLHSRAALEDAPAPVPPLAAVALSGPPRELQGRW